MSIFWTKNYFIMLIDSDSENAKPGRLLGLNAKPAELAQVRHLEVDVVDDIIFTQDNRDTKVRSLKREMVKVVNTIDTSCHHLKHLSIYYISAYRIEVPKLRRNIDALLTDPSAPPVRLKRKCVLDNRRDKVT